MPLDTGGLTEIDSESQAVASAPAPEDLTPTVASGANIGQALRAVRESKGLTLEDVAEETRVRRAYLAAIEEMRLDALPSRPFTIGYIRAYANELGLDGEAAVGRFRAEEPEPDQSLREPLGVQAGRDPRLVLVGVGGAVIIAAIFIWNIAQRALSDNRPPPEPVAARSAQTVTPRPGAAQTAVSLGAPLPPPVESTTPPLYETPGLNEAVNAQNAAKAAEDGVAPPPAQPATQAPPAPVLATSFKPQGKVYGPPGAEASSVVVQALKPASLVVHSADGTVYFARYLSAGEAYRVPAQGGLTLDVADTNAFQLFAGAESKGVLPTGSTPVGKLVSAAPAAPRAAAAPRPAASTAPAQPAHPAAAAAAAAPAPAAAAPDTH